MIFRLLSLGIGTVVLVALAACRSAPAQFYALTPVSVAIQAPGVEAVQVVVGPVSVPAEVDMAPMVFDAGSNERRIDEQHRWIAPLSDSIGHVLASDLNALLPGSSVSVAGTLAGVNATFTVGVEIRRFESTLSDGATLDAVWTVRRRGDGAATPGRTTVRQPTGGSAVADIVAAHSTALATLSQDIASAIRTLTAAPGGGGTAK